ncbi:unnamed protein product [Paramecium pentaurelia]|uniref:Transmembrane protein n=1 Tax=Paramecium pentaurelia TaxID=43138 RepID=A0A8S1THW6_9CILI|nr:unnamed protein product [Paramecium pentaurelia]
MNKFEDDLKYAQKANGNEFLNWIQNLSFELIKQKEYSYGQEFLKFQHLVYELIFKQDGILNSSFRTTQMRFGSIEDTLFFIKILNVLSPNEQSFYQSLPSEYPFNPVQIDILPAHLQLFLKDPSIINMNSQFQTFQEIFQDNILIEKNQLKFCVSAKMMFWIYLLNGAVNFKESALNATENSQKILDCAFSKCKKKFNTKDFLLKQLTFNPYLILIRRIIEYMVMQIKPGNTIQNNQNKQITIFTFQQMIILLQEYSMYENLYVQKLLDLNLTNEQQKLFYKIKPSSVVLDTQMMLIYLTIFFNNRYGQDLEATYSQFKHFIKSTDILSKQSQIFYQNRGFFFECGRQKQQITYQQGLYKFLENSFKFYHNDRQCNQISLLSHLSTYVLFLRQQFAVYEISIYNQVLIFDQALLSCLISQNTILNQLQKQQNFQYKSNNPIARFILSELQPIYQLCKNKFGQCPQAILFKEYKPSNLLQCFESKFNAQEYEINFHFREIDQYRNQMKNLLRVHYPFYTKLLIGIFKCISNLSYLSDPEYQGIMHLLTFIYSQDQNSFFCDLLKFQQNQPYQIPAYFEVKNFCDVYIKDSKEEEFQIKQNENIQKWIQQIIIQLMQYQQQKNIKNDRIVQYLGEQFNIPISTIKVVPIRNLSLSKSTGRLSRAKIQINQWKAPLRDFEFYFLFVLMWYLSLGLDKFRGQQINEFPSTQWPRKLASPVNLLIVSILTYIVITLVFMLF